MIPMMNYYSRVSKDIGARIRENVLEREDFFQNFRPNTKVEEFNLRK